jgi:O-antigen ligase
MQLWVLLITALVPLAIAPGVVSAFDITPKIAILLFCESVLLAFCKQLVNGSRALLHSGAGRRFTWVLIAQWLWMAASTALSTDPVRSITGSSWRREGFIVETALILFAWIAGGWLTEDHAGDQGGMVTVLRAVCIAGLAGSIYGIVQYFGWDPFLPAKAYQSGEGPFIIVRPPGTLGHADYFAAWLAMVVFLAILLAGRETGSRWKGAARLCAFLGVFAIVLTGTRSALLGLVMGTLVFFAIARPRLDRTAVTTAAIFVTSIGILFVSPAGLKLRARVHWSLDDARGGARLLLWRDGLRMAVKKPLLGYGPETFTSQFPPFESVALARAYPDFYQESPHNVFIDVLASEGVPGAAIFIALCGWALWTARKSAALAAALTAGLVCLQFMVLTIPTALYFYLVIAMIAANAGAIPTKARRVPIVTFPLAAAVALEALVFLFFAVRITVADRATALAYRYLAGGDVGSASRSYETAARWDPSSGNRDLNYARAMIRVASTTQDLLVSVAAAQQAFDSATKATKKAEDRQNAWYTLATISALRNDRSGVEKSLRQAIAFAPNWFKPRWTLAQVLELTGRHAEARREAAIALELNGGHDAEVTASAGKILSVP